MDPRLRELPGRPSVSLMIHRLEITVDPSTIDANAHVNNVEYLRWMQDAAISHADAAGGTALTRADGASWVARSHHIEYLRPAFAGERLTIHTWVSTVKRSSSLRKYRIVRNGTLIARGETVWVYVEAATGKPRPIPPEVRRVFALVPPEDEPAEFPA
jgi:acyl-CoA thioester hydrolase